MLDAAVSGVLIVTNLDVDVMTRLFFKDCFVVALKLPEV